MSVGVKNGAGAKHARSAYPQDQKCAVLPDIPRCANFRLMHIISWRRTVALAATLQAITSQRSRCSDVACQEVPH
jgi:hypothetical protein